MGQDVPCAECVNGYNGKDTCPMSGKLDTCCAGVQLPLETLKRLGLRPDPPPPPPPKLPPPPGAYLLPSGWYLFNNTTCPACGKTVHEVRGWVNCQKWGGLVCMTHCYSGCEYHAEGVGCSYIHRNGWNMYLVKRRKK